MSKFRLLFMRLVVFSFVIFIFFVAYNFSISASTDLFNSNNEEYIEQVLTDSELEDQYSDFNSQLADKLKFEMILEETLSDYVVEVQPGLYIIEVPSDVYNTLSEEIQSVVDASIESYEGYQKGELVLNSEGYLVDAETASNYVRQSNSISIVKTYTRVAFINVLTGFDIVVAKGPWSIVLLSIFLAAGAASLVYDILTFDRDLWARIAYTTTGTVATIMSQVISMYEKIPSYIVTGIMYLMRYSSRVVSSQIALIVTFLKFLFPPFAHTSRMLDLVNSGKKITIHYTTVFYSSFSYSS